MTASCTNDAFICQLLSTVVYDSWTLYLMEGTFQPSCEKVMSEQMLPPQCIIGRMPVAISLDKANVCIVSAQKEITFPGIGNRVEDVKYFVFMACNGMVAAVYGTDLVHNLTRVQTEGADLVVKFGEDRGIYGL